RAGRRLPSCSFIITESPPAKENWLIFRAPLFSVRMRWRSHRRSITRHKAKAPRRLFRRPTMNTASSKSFRLLQPCGREASTYHAVFVEAIFSDYVVLIDPARGARQKVSRSQFQEEWNGEAVHVILAPDR